MAGSANGQLQTGRYVDVDGERYANVFISIHQMFGLPTETFGKYGHAPLSAL